MTTTTKILLVPVFAALVTVLGVGAAVASEVGGTVGTGGGSSNQEESYTDGSLVATVNEGGSQSSSEGSESGSSAASSERRGGRSDMRNGSRASSGGGDDVVIILDDGSAAPASSGFAGTGGGYDPELEATLAGGADDNVITPGEAVAINSANNPLVNTDLIAASGETGLSSAKVWTAIVLGLALLGLAGYAVNALIAYRRENDL